MVSGGESLIGGSDHEQRWWVSEGVGCAHKIPFFKHGLHIFSWEIPRSSHTVGNLFALIPHVESVKRA